MTAMRMNARPGVLPVPPPPPRIRFGFRRTIRLRLTLLYIGLFLASAACLLVITYFLVAGRLPHTFTRYTSGPGTSTSQELITNGAGLTRATLDQLLIESGIALGIMAVVSVGLGWLMAGRVLSPLRTITAAARRISARSLHQRIGMTGPDDELKELGDTFDQLLGRLDASFRAQRQFVANASHELRTPLARQRTLLEVALRDRQASLESLRTACERALAAGEQQERLIAALLTLARGERGLDTFEPFDLGAITASALAAQRGDAPDRGLVVTADIGTAETFGDPRLAERLAANLIDNAIRYNTDGGQVEVAAGTRDGRAFLAVTNSGAVIPADQLGRLFQPFQRLDRARIGSAPGAGAGTGSGTGAGSGLGLGLGLGLAIVSAIAGAHGAELRAVARGDGGLAVEVLFPRRVGDGAGGDGAGRDGVSGPGKRKVARSA
jgi:signal transduction histidine kinase